MMTYRQVLPSHAVADFVECYWLMEDDGSSRNRSELQRIVPDGRPELILNLGDPFENFLGERWARQPDFFFAGQITGPMLVRPAGRTKILGVRFRPQGASRLFRLPMRELTNRTFSLLDLSPTMNRRVVRLKELSSTLTQIACLDRALRAFATPARSQDELVKAGIRQIEAHAGLIDPGDVARRIGTNPRQLQRWFHTTVGVGPKLFARIQRFQRVFGAIEQSQASWVQVALDCGYYDQSHLVRDFRDFAGEPPSVVLNPETDLAFHFLRSRTIRPNVMSQFSKTAQSSSQ